MVAYGQMRVELELELGLGLAGEGWMVQLLWS
jgi:hypothetical protein